MSGGKRERITKPHKETSGGDGHVHYLNCGGGFTNIHIHQNYQIIHFKCVQLIAF